MSDMVGSFYGKHANLTWGSLRRSNVAGVGGDWGGGGERRATGGNMDINHKVTRRQQVLLSCSITCSKGTGPRAKRHDLRKHGDTLLLILSMHINVCKKTHKS